MVFQDKSRDYNHAPLFSKRAPDNDTFTRDICDTCGFIDYVNPKIVAGVVALWEGKILMCRRDIEPRKGFWTLPAGFMEQLGATQQGAARGAKGEACAGVDSGPVRAV